MESPLFELHKKVMTRIRDEHFDLINTDHPSGDQLLEIQKIYDRIVHEIS